ncbi:MAG: hypothetical protein ACQEW2_10775 [Bacillota bacterium]
MATKKITLRNYDGTVWDELHPRTSAEQVVTDSTRQFVSDTERLTWNAKEDSSKKGIANGYAGLDASGKIPTDQLPALAITDTFVVATQTAMLALSAEVGDVAVRSDLSKSFILKATPASTLANWQELLTPANAVTSVAGKTGAVTLSAGDVGLGNVTNESKATMFTSPSLTGTPTAPTAATATNTTQIATTAFVKAQGYATSASPALTGTPTAPTPTTGDSTTKVATTAFVQNAVQNVSSSMPKITVGATQPTSPGVGDFWYEVV